jgi:hypothetical protein
MKEGQGFISNDKFNRIIYDEDNKLKAEQLSNQLDIDMHSHEYIKDYLIKIINQKDESSSIFYTFNMFLLNSNNNKIIFKVLYHIKNLVFLVFFFKF